MVDLELRTNQFNEGSRRRWCLLVRADRIGRNIPDQQAHVQDVVEADTSDLQCRPRRVLGVSADLDRAVADVYVLAKKLISLLLPEPAGDFLVDHVFRHLMPIALAAGIETPHFMQRTVDDSENRVAISIY
jgi:hypothetical protein